MFKWIRGYLTPHKDRSNNELLDSFRDEMDTIYSRMKEMSEDINNKLLKINDLLCEPNHEASTYRAELNSRTKFMEEIITKLINHPHAKESQEYKETAIVTPPYSSNNRLSRGEELRRKYGVSKTGSANT